MTRWLLVLLLAMTSPGACAGQTPAPCGDTALAGERLDALRQSIFPETDDEVLLGYGRDLRRRLPGLRANDRFAIAGDAATCARVATAAPRLREALGEPGVSLLRLGGYLAVMRWRPADGSIHDPYAEIIEVLDAETLRVVAPGA